jgi:hypothetical protein
MAEGHGQARRTGSRFAAAQAKRESGSRNSQIEDDFGGSRHGRTAVWPLTCCGVGNARLIFDKSGFRFPRLPWATDTPEAAMSGVLMW